MSNFAYENTRRLHLCGGGIRSCSNVITNVLFNLSNGTRAKMHDNFDVDFFFLSSGHIVLHTVEIAVSLRQNPALMFRQARKLKKLYFIMVYPKNNQACDLSFVLLLTDCNLEIL